MRFNDGIPMVIADGSELFGSLGSYHGTTYDEFVRLQMTGWPSRDYGYFDDRLLCKDHADPRGHWRQADADDCPF